ncbi:MAG: prepilin-type N-terminal cleavage/methylation domain-containing protein [Candidatus Pacebacteria bacterium]|nr:prepilin-type N-terminal cleavage/methylation domain-containing protein [Candidatus Paceibacterota bacterium]
MSSSPHKSSGFSLIELLVSIVIIMLLVSGAVASYTSFIEKQRLVAVAEKIESGFREAQNMAKIGYLGECDQLQFVNFSVYNYESDPGRGLYYQISIRCYGEPADATYSPGNKSLVRVSEGNKFTTSDNLYDLKFYPLGNLSRDASFTISSTGSTSTATFNIDHGGSIKVTY